MTSASSEGRAGVGRSLARRRGLLLVVAASVLWVFLADNYWVFIGTRGLVLAISTLGLLVLVGWGREISLAQAGLVGSAAYICGYAYRSRSGASQLAVGQKGVPGLGLPYLVSALIAIGFVVLVSVLVALVAVKLSGVYVMVLTLAVQFLLENTLMANSKMTGGIAAVYIPRPALFGIHLESTRAFYFFTLAVLGLSAAALYRFRHSKYGRSLLLVGWDRQAAAAAGVSPWRYKVLAFAVAGAFAGVAGVIIAPLFKSPPGAFDYISFNSLFYLAIPILAGFESLSGVVIVAMGFTVLPSALETFRISPNLYGAAGIGVGTAIGPRGVSGFVSDRLHRRKRSTPTRRDDSDREDLRPPTAADRNAESRPTVAVR